MPFFSRFHFSPHIVGSEQSRTADELWMIENAKKGIQAVSVVSAATLLSPVLILACPVVGAYEFSRLREEELITGSSLVDGVIGGLFGVVASPLAPFYVMWDAMTDLFSQPPPPPMFPSTPEEQRAIHRIGIDNNHFYNVAVVGGAGTGKSSLVNGLLGYRDHHTRAAPVGESTTTTEPRGYRHPILHTLMLWDFPGVATKQHPTAQYFDEFCLAAFDAIIIVISERLMAYDVALAQKAISYNIPLFFIRNKADTAIEAKIRKMSHECYTEDKKWMMAVGQFTSELQSSITRNMSKFNFKTEWLYIISSWTLQDFVISLRDRKPTHNLRLIHEKVLIINLLDAIEQKRQREENEAFQGP